MASWGWKKGQQSQGIGVVITKPWPQSYRNFVGRTEKACKSKEAYKPDSVTPALSGGLSKTTWNVWPKLNNLKEMLLNTNWVCVNLWPTGNVMKEIKSEINHSLYLTEASLFFLLVTFSSGFFAAIRPWRPESYGLLWTVEMSVYLNSVKHLFGLQFLRLVTLMNLSSKFLTFSILTDLHA
jgi:hypothetical protein